MSHSEKIIAYWRPGLLVLIILAFFIVILSAGPIPQPLEYHDFADKRSFGGIPNTLNVLTNIVFLIVGIAGAVYCSRHKQKDAPRAWLLFFLGVAAVSFGSAYYHWKPDNHTLVWDRLPMTAGFMGLMVGILCEHVNRPIERYLLVPMILLGLFSVVYWHVTDDLRIYIWVQYAPLLCVPVILVLFQPRYTRRKYLLVALGFYIFAKICEVWDDEVFILLHQQISGHSMKHILAACGPLWIFWMLKHRRPVEQALSE
jgi:hypothetical protein